MPLLLIIFLFFPIIFFIPILTTFCGNSLALSTKKNEIEEYIEHRDRNRKVAKANKEFEELLNSLKLNSYLNLRKKDVVNKESKEYIEVNEYGLNPKYAEIITEQIKGNELSDKGIELTTYVGNSIGANKIYKEKVYKGSLANIITLIYVILITSVGLAISSALGLLTFIIAISSIKPIHELSEILLAPSFGTTIEKRVPKKIVDTIGVIAEGERIGDLLINATPLQIPLQEETDRKFYIQVTFKRYQFKNLEERSLGEVQEHVLMKYFLNGETPFKETQQEKLFTFIIIHEDDINKAKDIIISKLRRDIERAEELRNLKKNEILAETKNKYNRYI